MRRYGGAVALLALVAASCSGTGAKKAVEPHLVEAWRNASIMPIGQPVHVGEGLVVYGTEGKDLYLYGVSPADGTVRWRQAATPSVTSPGTFLTPTVLDDRVLYFRPDPKATLYARLVVASPDTGNDVFVSDPALFRSHPSHCTDGKNVCVSTLEASGPVSRRFSVDAEGPVRDVVATPAGSRLLGTNLIDLGTRQPESLAEFRDGATQWRAPLTTFFSPGFTTDRGWDFELYKTDHMHVGSVGRPPDKDDAVAVVTDLSKQETAAIEATTGKLAWRSDGTSFLCGATVEVERGPGGGEREWWPVRCRYQGTRRYDRATATSTYQGLDVTLEGFDVQSGATTWSVALGAAEKFVDSAVPQVSAREVLVRAATGPMIVDLATGRTRPPGVGETVWCTTEAWFTYRERFTISTGEGTDRWRGDHLAAPCAADGSPATAVPSYPPTWLGATAGADRTVVATAQGLVAYDRRGAPPS